MNALERLNLPEMKDMIRDLVEKATAHSPIYGTNETYLYSTIHITVPIGKMMYKTVSMRRKIVAESGNDMNNEEQSAVQYFLNNIMFILRSSDYVVEDLYADDDESYDVVVGKSFLNINRARLGMPRLYATNGADIVLDLTKDEQ